MIKYGEAPVVIDIVQINEPQFMTYLYLPIKLKHDKIKLPDRLQNFWPLIRRSLLDFAANEGDNFNVNVYITVKSGFVSQGNSGNREGWHVDGFGSHGDINYIWSDLNPTQFAIQQFAEISENDKLSMKQMADQICGVNIKTYPNNSLLKLHEGVVHRVNPNVKSGFRSFVKISFSEHIFNNEGNSHNYLIDYNWKMIPRSVERNIDSKVITK